MRTGSVRILTYGSLMINPATAEALARDHQHELRRTAERDRLARRLRATSVHRFRTRAGWWLVHAGIRLALTADFPADHARPSPTTRAASA
jgi:hypothetical protein